MTRIDLPRSCPPVIRETGVFPRAGEAVLSRAAQPYQRPSASRSAGRARGASAQPDSLGSQAELERLEHALRLVAELLLVDPVYAPIFRRLEQEIAIERARLSDDILARARSIIRQSAIGSSMDRTSASEPPSP